ncbi:olfactory receptor-like protein DTMT [Pelodiscus sinensis]|uniref:olfactory receptor-like protein DTMT n=1 Tax=Pelodiscus sinensis TaxID=13735 RepID=UPI003F6BE99F
MAEANWTSISEFVLLGLSERQDLQQLIFAGFLVTYLLNLAGNSMLVGLVWTDPQLHSPMYFLLSQLSMVDMGLVSIILPQALVHTLTQHRAIPFASCMAQLFILLAVGNMQDFLLAAMAYDRYMAICNPLRYAAVVTRFLCLKIVAASWVVVILHALLHAVMAARLRYCSNRLQNFFCNLQLLLRLPCTRPFANEMVISTVSLLVTVVPFTFILVSYACIGVTVVRLRSAQVLHKALSTCSSHLTVVLLMYGSELWFYLHPDSSNSPHKQQVTFFYTSVVPTLNPLIYSLRNKDVAAALRRAKMKVLG